MTIKNHPIVTVKVESIAGEGSVGPDVTFTAQVLRLGPQIKFGVKARNKFLLSKAWNPAGVSK